ncbi:DUF3883 domain-containing protein [Methylorubrum populi]|uniref:DUF3883 domain-containing protein n=1 Tax=Methylorubrum populi TaxID=223967 RepID=UPI002355260B|nr:DUF3883 domain-containing protein [Methylorubrum populi]
MDWNGAGFGGNVLEWLEAAAADRYARERRLDPFATSMRDFDDVASHLHSIRARGLPAMTDSAQRITDLRNAGLVASDGKSLTSLGEHALSAWDLYGASTALVENELARLLIVVLEANKLEDKDYANLSSYWIELRTSFDPLALIDNWDSLYTLNYLDYERDGFAPGTAFRTGAIPVSEIEFDLADFAARNGGSRDAVDGASRIERAISGKIPRGRHRSTFCMALEMVASRGSAAADILDRFGLPKKPRSWTKFTEVQREQVLQILKDYGVNAALAADAAPKPEAGVAAHQLADTTSTDGAVDETKLPPSLPPDIDFSVVLTTPPPGRRAPSDAGASSVGRGPWKADHKKKAEKNDHVGKLGEEFAIAYERWRLRNHPELLEKLRHVSKDDDSLGYDIESYETDGTLRLVEVKATLGPLGSRFFISANELACAAKNDRFYLILRVASLTENPTCCELRFPFNELEMVPESYSVSFKARDEMGT